MQAIVATPEGAGWTERREIPAPEPAHDEALIAVRAFAINRGELRLLPARGDGWRPGQDVAGEVVQAAADGSGPRAGERVAGLADWHGWAQLAAVPAHRLAALPENVDFPRAAALPMAGTTAANLVRLGGPLLGRRVLVTGASGGVGHLAVQLAAAGGAEVTAVARTGSVRGAAAVVDDVGTAEGLYDLILESVGGRSLAAAIEKVAPRGTIALFGNSSNEPTSVGFGSFVGHEDARIQIYYSRMHEHEAGDNLRLLLDLLAAGRLEVEIGFQESWDRIEDALNGLRDRRFGGKAVLLVE